MPPARIHRPLAAICALLALVVATLAPGLHSHDTHESSLHAASPSACDSHECDHHAPAHPDQRPQHCSTCELLLLALSAPSAAPPLALAVIARSPLPDAPHSIGLIELHKHPRAIPARGPPRA